MPGATTRKPDRGERLNLLEPAIPEFGEALQQEDQWSLAGLDVVQSHVADFGVALAQTVGPGLWLHRGLLR